MQKSLQIARVVIVFLAVFFSSGLINAASASTLTPRVLTNNPISKAAVQIGKVSFTSSVDKAVQSKAFLGSVEVEEVKVEKEPKEQRVTFAVVRVVEQTVSPETTKSETNAAGLNADVIFTMINEHRAKLGLPAYVKNDQLCALAASRGPQLHSEIFVTHTMHAGLYNRNLPYWITENMIHQKTEADAMNWWLNSPVHRAAVEGNYTYSCGTCVGFDCEQLFTNFQAKYPQASSPTPTPQTI